MKKDEVQKGKGEDIKKSMLIGSFDEFIKKVVEEYQKNFFFPTVIYLPFNWKILMLLGDWLKPGDSIMKSNGKDKIIVGMHWGISFIVDKKLDLEVFKVEFGKYGIKGEKIETRKWDAFLWKKQ